jgi:hypothetical protein
LLPEQNTGTNLGGSMAVIGSQRWPALTLHVNGVVSLERNRDVSALGSLIVEGPSSWTVRPVAEGAFERPEPGARVWSGLVGLIWRAWPSLVLDVAGRRAQEPSGATTELRAGLTWAFSPG